MRIRAFLVLGLAVASAAAQAPRVSQLEVWENRTAQRGRKIKLQILVLPALDADAAAEPIFYLAGGPGQAATSVSRGFERSWLRRKHDLVFVDQRGTGRSNPLRVALPGDDRDLQSWLDPLFDEARFRAALPRLEKRADLTQYTTEIAADDLEEVRRSLGYGKVNLVGGSYGTRMALVYMRRHPKSVRCAVLNGVAPPAFKNPLYHAAAAQEGLDKLIAECKQSYPDLGDKLTAVLARLDETPAKVGRVRLDRAAFCEALRVMLYYLPSNRRVPALIDRAWRGDLRPFAGAAIRSNRSLRRQLAFGMLMCVTGSEDIPRITEEEIVRETKGTFLGDQRVRSQCAIARFWPRGKVSPDYGDPVTVAVPTLVLSGTLDPVTPPRWGAEAARHLPNSLHVIAPGAHGVGGPCIASIMRAFIESGSVAGLDTSCVKRMKLPPIPVPTRKKRWL